MRGFFLGLFLGAVAATIVFWALHSPAPPTPPAPPPPTEPMAPAPISGTHAVEKGSSPPVPGPGHAPSSGKHREDPPRRSEPKPAVPPVDPAIRKELRDLVRSVPFPSADFASFGSFLDGEYVSRADLPDKEVLAEKAHLLLPGSLRTEIDLRRGGSVYARDGIAAGGVVRYGGYAGVAVKGEMAGKIEGQSYGYLDVSGDLSGEILLESYGYLHVGGNLTGKATVKSYATVLVDGDVTGTLTLSSSTTLILRGRVPGTLEAERCTGTFYLDRFVTREEVETLGGGPDIVLHVRESDLPAGKNAEIGKWKEVVVADPFWEKVPR